jgi:hypothetical protein
MAAGARGANGQPVGSTALTGGAASALSQHPATEVRSAKELTWIPATVPATSACTVSPLWGPLLFARISPAQQAVLPLPPAPSLSKTQYTGHPFIPNHACSPPPTSPETRTSSNLGSCTLTCGPQHLPHSPAPCPPSVHTSPAGMPGL